MNDDAIEAVAKAGYECSEWGHKQPWDKNPWARKAWRECAAVMLAALPVEEMIRQEREACAQIVDGAQLQALPAIAARIRSRQPLDEPSPQASKRS